ncbi:MAG: class I SAM-dependent methyltransferase [Chitinophagaceae bacterium]
MKSNNKAAKTDYLFERITQNENFQTIDINKWAFEKIEGTNETLNILELCCGTGKQTKCLLETFPNSTISCLDISNEAIDVVKASNKDDQHRMIFFNTGIDDFFYKSSEKYDIIFCSYGLYYSLNIEIVFSRIKQSLNSVGRFIVMGPYGNNNKQLFDLILRLNINIAEPVLHSSSKFMVEDVLKFAANNFKQVHIYTTRNSIKWLDANSVISYWQNSTFFEEDKKEDFILNVSKEIENNHFFLNDKYIMLIEAINHEYVSR